MKSTVFKKGLQKVFLYFDEKTLMGHFQTLYV